MPNTRILDQSLERGMVIFSPQLSVEEKARLIRLTSHPDSGIQDSLVNRWVSTIVDLEDKLLRLRVEHLKMLDLLKEANLTLQELRPTLPNGNLCDRISSLLVDSFNNPDFS